MAAEGVAADMPVGFRREEAEDHTTFMGLPVSKAILKVVGEGLGDAVLSSIGRSIPMYLFEDTTVIGVPIATTTITPTPQTRTSASRTSGTVSPCTPLVVPARVTPRPLSY